MLMRTKCVVRSETADFSVPIPSKSWCNASKEARVKRSTRGVIKSWVPLFISVVQLFHASLKG